MKSILEQIPDAQVKSYIQKLGSEFYAPIPTAADIKDAESIILIGFPIAQTPQSIIQLIAKEAEQGKPIFLLLRKTLIIRNLEHLNHIFLLLFGHQDHKNFLLLLKYKKPVWLVLL